MGGATKAVLRKGVSADQILSAIQEKYDSEAFIDSVYESHLWINFRENGDYRNMFVNPNNKEYIEGVFLSLGCWGNSAEIMKYLCETFGGWTDENDCDKQGYYLINKDAYESGTDFTEVDKLKMRIMAEVGHQKANIIMEILKEYKDVLAAA